MFPTTDRYCVQLWVVSDERSLWAVSLTPNLDLDRDQRRERKDGRERLYFGCGGSVMSYVLTSHGVKAKKYRDAMRDLQYSP